MTVSSGPAEPSFRVSIEISCAIYLIALEQVACRCDFSRYPRDVGLCYVSMTSAISATALIAGASSGVGAATARILAQAGIGVGLMARREDRLHDLANDIRAAGGWALPIPADIRCEEGCRRAVQTLQAATGAIDILVNAAGTNVARRKLDELRTEDWEEILATNLSGAFYLVRAVLPGMRDRGAGLIIHISSVAGAAPSALSGAAYSASKAGLNALSTCTNLEEGRRGIRSCVILPGDVNTELLDRRPEPPDAAARATMLQPDDVAAVVAQIVHQPGHVVVDEVMMRPATRSGR
jgi:NADP-dependent 3-hydroxy acid dehydrogenase YdfG